VKFSPDLAERVARETDVFLIATSIYRLHRSEYMTSHAFLESPGFLIDSAAPYPSWYSPGSKPSTSSQ
jgi:hypothetical protein